jgi:hypothetical protein
MENPTRMMFRLPVVLGAAGLVAFATVAKEVKLDANLAGVSEVPGPGDPDATGSADITIKVDSAQACYSFDLSNVEDLTQAHIHSGTIGQSGPPVVTLSTEMKSDSEGCASAERDVLEKIAANPTDYYVNVHNAEFPNGALRGQLRRAGGEDVSDDDDKDKDPPARR